MWSFWGNYFSQLPLALHFLCSHFSYTLQGTLSSSWIMEKTLVSHFLLSAKNKLEWKKYLRDTPIHMHKRGEAKWLWPKKVAAMSKHTLYYIPKSFSKASTAKLVLDTSLYISALLCIQKSTYMKVSYCRIQVQKVTDCRIQFHKEVQEWLTKVQRQGSLFHLQDPRCMVPRLT